MCVYADEINNDRRINHNMVYAQLYQELNEGRRYWFNEQETARNIEQNCHFQQVNDYGQMINLTYLSVEDTPEDTEFIPLRNIMLKLQALFPSFNISKSTETISGKQLSMMGYQRYKSRTGICYKVKGY